MQRIEKRIKPKQMHGYGKFYYPLNSRQKGELMTTIIILAILSFTIVFIVEFSFCFRMYKLQMSLITVSLLIFGTYNTRYVLFEKQN